MVRALPPGWNHGEHDQRIKVLQLLPRKVCVLFATEAARIILPHFESVCPDDSRPRLVIETAEQLAFGNASAASVIAAASYAVNAYAYAAYAYAVNAVNAVNTVNAAAFSVACTAVNATYTDRDFAVAVNAAYVASYTAVIDVDIWQTLYAIYTDALGFQLEFHPRWKTNTIVSIAKSIRQNRAFDLFPVLADALEDAGCDYEPLVIHLRDEASIKTQASWTLINLLGCYDLAL